MEIPTGGFSRARVAITLPTKPEGLDPLDWSGFVIHLGHARTLLLGSLIAEEVGCPFHVRLDQVYGTGANFGPSMLDLTECLHFLGLRPAKVYVVRTGLSGDVSAHYRAAGLRGPLWEALLALPDALHSTQKALLLDDYVEHPRSLLVRGRDFCEPAQHCSPQLAIGAQYVLAQEQFFRLLGGFAHYEVNVPLVTVSGCKLSKTAVRVIHWSVLKAAGSEAAIRFLTATALDARDPLSALGRPFGIAALDFCSYEWDWATFGEMIRRSG